MYSNKLYTPLRYPGGKARFAPFIADMMRANNIDGGHYLEPYAGGAGVALALLFEGVATNIHINDADPAVAAFWLAATRENSQLVDLVRTQPVNMDAWHHWRAVMLGQVKTDTLHRGFATLFMNRTNRSGILKAGVIGGKEQSGAYKIDARFMRDALAARLEKIGEWAENIHVYSEDALSILSRCNSFLPSRSLIYLDPPYYVKGQGLYRNFYDHEDHVQVANLIQSRSFSRRWMVSYDNAPEIRQMYKSALALEYGLAYTAQIRYSGSEVMFFCEGIQIESAYTKNLPDSTKRDQHASL